MLGVPAMISSDALNHAIAQAKRQRQITETVSGLELHDPKTVELLRTTCESILRSLRRRRTPSTDQAPLFERHVVNGVYQETLKLEAFDSFFKK